MDKTQSQFIACSHRTCCRVALASRRLLSPRREVDFEADPRSGETPLAVTFTPLVQGDISSWMWDFGDRTTSTEQNPEHTYTNAGTYSVTPTVEPRWGRAVSTTKTSYITATGRDMVVAPYVHHVRQ